ncbi:hypothetical protein [Desulfosporosinus sp. FKA]|nr:hypothetical protein [Desulfosporosinus sp. FKA]
MPKISVSVRPGRNLASIIEVAVMQNRLRLPYLERRLLKKDF